MDTPMPRDEPSRRRANTSTATSESASRTVTANASRQATSDGASSEDIRGGGESTIRSLHLDHGRAHLHHTRSKPIYIEPPPVVKRPAKIKNETFSLKTSLFSWVRTEQQDGLYCARSTHKLYNYASYIQIFGFSIGRTVEVDFTNEGINSAVETVRVGNQTWSKNRLEEARRRLGKYSSDQRKDIEAATAAANQAAEGSSYGEKKKLADLDGRDDSASTLPEQQQQDQTPQEENSLHQHPYVIVGFMGDESVPKETIRRILQPNHLFKELHRAHRHLRKPHRRLLSLKECAGFGIYECDSAKGYHREVDLDRETERALAELWRSYCGHKYDYEGRWLSWIHHNFNNGSNNPEEGRLTLEFKLRWSVLKVVFWGIVPVLLSLAIGFWYMYSDHGEVTDKVAIAEAAWVIASYIVTTSARKSKKKRFSTGMSTHQEQCCWRCWPSSLNLEIFERSFLNTGNGRSRPGDGLV